MTGPLLLLLSATNAQADLPPPPPNVHMNICLSQDGQPVPPDHVFVTGHTISLSITPPDSGHMYIVNIDPAGHVGQIFPWSGEDNSVVAGQPISIPPASSSPILLAEPSGPEEVYIFWSPKPMHVAAGGWTDILSPEPAYGVLEDISDTPEARSSSTATKPDAPGTPDTPQSWLTAVVPKELTANPKRLIRGEKVDRCLRTTFTASGEYISARMVLNHRSAPEAQ